MDFAGSLRKELDKFKFWEHVMGALLSVQLKCSHRCVFLKKSLVKAELSLKHAANNHTKKTSKRAKRFEHIEIEAVMEHLLSTASHASFRAAASKSNARHLMKLRSKGWFNERQHQMALRVREATLSFRCLSCVDVTWAWRVAGARYSQLVNIRKKQRREGN